jgi:dynein heavy chain
MLGLADIGRTIEGVLQLGIQETSDKSKYARLWVHESFRCFSDRIADEADQECFLKVLREAALSSDIPIDDMDFSTDIPVFCTVMDQLPPYEKTYDEIADKERLRQIVENSLEELIRVEGKPVELVLFAYTIDHVLRISRIIQHPHGCAILVGCNSTGKRSLTRLASHMCGNRTVEFQTRSRGYGWASWREDIKELLMVCGRPKACPQTCIISCDPASVRDEFLQDVHGLLNSGEVMCLWSPEEKAEIAEMIYEVSKEPTRATPDSEDSGRSRRTTPTSGGPEEKRPSWNSDGSARFVAACHERLRLVLMLAPSTDVMQQRLRQIPAILHHCTLDWFQAWPASGFESVAQMILSKSPASSLLPTSCAKACQLVQSGTMDMSKRLFAEQQRYYHATPAAYLALLNSFVQLLGDRRQDAH